MRQWLKRILGSSDGPQTNPDINPVDDYVVVKKRDLEALVSELQSLRNQGVNMDARELDMMVAELELENTALKKELRKCQEAATMNHRE